MKKKTPAKTLRRMRSYYAANSVWIKKRNKKYWLSKPEQERKVLTRQRTVKHMYNLTAEQHLALLKKQSFKCPISGLPVNIYSHIDHDHLCCSGEKSCGQCVRGILAGKINSALGMFPNPKWLLGAYKYLTRKR
jgi:Recombination endonuclease VII